MSRKIDKKTRTKIVKLLIKRKKRLGYGKVDVIDLMQDMVDLSNGLAKTLEELGKLNILKEEKNE